MNKEPKAQWYEDLMLEFESLTSKYGIEGKARDDIQLLLLHTARNQYLAGNRAGIRWAREHASTYGEE
jgi:hypothetical protein